jgi:hypothetical protein
MIGAVEDSAEARDGHPACGPYQGSRGLVGMIGPTDLAMSKVARSRGLPSRHLSILLDVGRAPGGQPRRTPQFRATAAYLKVICRRWRASATAEDARRGHQRPRSRTRNLRSSQTPGSSPDVLPSGEFQMWLAYALAFQVLAQSCPFATSGVQRISAAKAGRPACRQSIGGIASSR